MVLHQKHISSLYELHGDNYIVASLCDLNKDTIHSKTYRTLIGNGFSSISEIKKTLEDYALKIFRAANNIISKVSWESLVFLEVPNYFESLKRVIQQITDSSSKVATNELQQLLQAFFAGSYKLFEFMNQLVFKTVLTDKQKDIINFVTSQGSNILSLLSTYGTSVANALKVLFTGIGEMISSILTIYNNAMSTLGKFVGELCFTIRRRSSKTKELMLQAIIFLFLGLQEVVGVAQRNVASARRYVNKFIDNFYGQISGALDETVFSFIMKIPLISSLVPYLKNVTNKVLFIISYVQKLLANIPYVLYKFIDTVVTRLTDTFGDILRTFRTFIPDKNEKMITLYKELKEKITDNRISESTKRNMKISMDKVDEFNLDLELFNNEKTIVDSLNTVVLGSSVLTRVYLDKPVDQEDLDTYLRSSTGYNSCEITLQLEYLYKIMNKDNDTANLEIKLGKSKVEEMIGAPEGLWSSFLTQQKTREERLAEVEDALRDKIRVIKEIRAGDDYLAEQNKIEEERRDFINDGLEKIKNDTSNDDIELLEEKTVLLETKSNTLFNLKITTMERGITKEGKTLYDLENEKITLEQERRSLLSWIRFKDMGPKFIASVSCLLIIAFGTYYYVTSYLDQLEKDKERKTNELFNNLIEQSRDDPIVRKCVKEFAKKKDIEQLTPDALSDYSAFVRDFAGQIERGEKSTEEVNSWAIELQASLDDYNNRKNVYNRVLKLQVPESGKTPVPTPTPTPTPQPQIEADTSKTTWYDVTRIWSKKDKEETSISISDIQEIENYQNALQESVLSNNQKEVSEYINTVGRGLEFYKKKTNLSEKDFNNDVGFLLLQHSYAMGPIIRKQMAILRKNPPPSTAYQYIVAGFSSLMEKSALWAPAESDILNFKKTLDMGRKGYVPYVNQMATTWTGYSNFILIAVNLLIHVIYALVLAAVQTLFGEIELALGTLKSLENIIKYSVTAAGAQLIAFSFESFFNTFLIFKPLISIAILYFGWFTKAASWVTSTCRRKKQEKEAIKLDRQIINCSLCLKSPAIYVEQNNRNNVYCSRGCSFLNYNGKKIK